MTLKILDQYDVVVVGESIGSLLSACLAAEKGMSVLLVGARPLKLLSVSKYGQYFDPEPNYFLGVRSPGKWAGLLGKCLERLSICAGGFDMPKASEMILQVMTPDSRVVLNHDDNDFAVEIEREFRRNLLAKSGLLDAVRCSDSGFLRYWLELGEEARGNHSDNVMCDFTSHSKAGLGYSHGWERNLKDIWINRGLRVSDLNKMVGSNGFSEITTGLAFATLNRTLKDPFLGDVLHMVALDRTAAAFRGGMTALRCYLKNLAERVGVRVELDSRCKSIFLDDKSKLVGVQLNGYGKMIGTSRAVFGCPSDEIMAYICATDKKSNKTKSPLQLFEQPCGWRFTIALSVHDEAIPPGMTARTVWQERDGPPMEIEVANPSDYGSAEPETKILFFRTVMPFTKESLDKKTQKLFAAKMFRQATRIMPFLEFHVKQVYPDFRSGVMTNYDDQPPYDFISLSDIPLNLRIFEKGGLGYFSGLTGIYLASEESFPELGTLGGVVAAIEAVRKISSGPLG